MPLENDNCAVGPVVLIRNYSVLGAEPGQECLWVEVDEVHGTGTRQRRQGISLPVPSYGAQVSPCSTQPNNTAII